MPEALNAAALDQIFREARTQNKWQHKPVAEETLRALYDLMKWGPTSANSSPARFVFITSDDAKAKLKHALSPGNVEKTMTAPVTVVVGHDPKFYDQLPKLFPQTDARSWFAGNWSLADTTAMRNGTLQGAYMIIAARALGLDVGAMSGFDNMKVDDLFFGDTGWKSNFLITLGHGDPDGIFPRNPRLDFDEACRIV